MPIVIIIHIVLTTISISYIFLLSILNGRIKTACMRAQIECVHCCLRCQSCFSFVVFFVFGSKKEARQQQFFNKYGYISTDIYIYRIYTREGKYIIYTMPNFRVPNLSDSDSDSDDVKLAPPPPRSVLKKKSSLRKPTTNTTTSATTGRRGKPSQQQHNTRGTIYYHMFLFSARFLWVVSYAGYVFETYNLLLLSFFFWFVLW
jgi:hypothetical protein